MSRTKIIATVGPACRAKKEMKELMRAGVNVFRLNFSHSTHDAHAESIKYIRQAAKEVKRPVAILADIQGPKIRTGKLAEGSVVLRRGKKVCLTAKPTVGSTELLHVAYDALLSVVKKNMLILLSEGEIALRVVAVHNDRVECAVVHGGPLGENKGVHMLGVTLPSAFTKKDKKDISFAVEHGVDYLAISFVQNAYDIQVVKTYLKKIGGSLPLIAKIEKPEAVRNLPSIMQEVQGVMVARGDLGIEGKLEEVPIWQKRIIREANQNGKIVVTATQMLESMITMPTPTRAEVTDVANAIFDGTDAIMLSGETAVGKYGVKAVRTMSRIARAAERSNLINYHYDRYDAHQTSTTFAIAHAAMHAAREANVKAIVVFTVSGFTAQFISKRRPSVPIFALTPLRQTYNQLSLLWDVRPILTSLEKDIDVAILFGTESILRQRLLKKGDRVVIVFGDADVPGGTDRMKIITLGE